MQFTKFVPFTKVNESKREVWGIVTAEVPDKSGETCNYTKTKPYYVRWSQELEKATDGKSCGNLRYMHTLRVVGKGVGIEYRDDDKEILMGFKVTDHDAWRDVCEGVLTGFSQGGSYVEGPDMLTKQYVADPSEISLVDNPCLSVAHFAFIKADGQVEMRKTRMTALTKDGAVAAGPASAPVENQVAQADTTTTEGISTATNVNFYDQGTASQELKDLIRSTIEQCLKEMHAGKTDAATGESPESVEAEVATGEDGDSGLEKAAMPEPNAVPSDAVRTDDSSLPTAPAPAPPAEAERTDSGETLTEMDTATADLLRRAMELSQQQAELFKSALGGSATSGSPSVSTDNGSVSGAKQGTPDSDPPPVVTKAATPATSVDDLMKAAGTQFSTMIQGMQTQFSQMMENVGNQLQAPKAVTSGTAVSKAADNSMGAPAATGSDDGDQGGSVEPAFQPQGLPNSQVSPEFMKAMQNVRGVVSGF